MRISQQNFGLFDCLDVTLNSQTKKKQKCVALKPLELGVQP